MKKILIIGATSAIAEHCARIWAVKGDAMHLVARNEQHVQTIAADLKVRGASEVSTYCSDLNDMDRHEALLDAAENELGSVDIVLIAHGTLSNQKKCEGSVEETLAEIHTNALSTISLLTLIANIFEAQKCGTICVISSIAGDRGRASNYVYGSAKGMVSVFLQGLRNRLHMSGVNVLDIKPGFIDTPMTAEFKKGILWAKPAAIAKVIVAGIGNHKYEIYAPYFWRFIMFIIKNIPEIIFKKLRL